MKIGMLFPGYGSQFVGMGKELYDTSRIVQEYFEEASSCLGINFVKLCFASSDAELAKINHAYPALYLTSIATAHVIKESGITIDLIAGHGVGEYGALTYAGGLSFPDGLYMLNKLALFYAAQREELDVKTVVVNGLSSRALRKICKEVSTEDAEAQITVYEKQTEHIVSGHTEAVETIVEEARDAGADKIRKVRIEEALHTPLVSDVFEQLTVYLTKVDFKDVTIPLLTNVDGKLVTKADEVQDAVMRQIVEPLYWHSIVKEFAAMDTIIIPAPSKSLYKEITTLYPDKTVLRIETIADIMQIRTVCGALQDIVLDDPGLLNDVEKSTEGASCEIE